MIARKILLSGLLCILASNVGAEPKSAGDAQMLQTLRKAQGLLRQMGEEKAQLEEKNAALEGKLKELEAKAARLAELENENRQQKAGLDALRGQNQALQSRLDGDGQRLQTLGERHGKTLQHLQKHKRDNQLLVGAVREREQWIGECADKNRSLRQVNQELVGRLGGERGFWESFKGAEPFTGIGQVERENVAQEYRFKLDDLQVTPWKAEAAPEAGKTAQAPREDEDEED